MPEHSVSWQSFCHVLVLALAFLLPPAAARAGDTVDFKLDVAGIGGKLEERMLEVSELASDDEEAPASLAVLERRARTDRDTFEQVLRARGFYAGTVELQIDREVRPVRVTFTVTRGPRYTLDRFDIDGLPPAAAELSTPAGLAELGVTVGAPALAEVVDGATGRLVTELARRAHPFAEIADRRVVVDHAAHTMTVLVSVDAGPHARFGEVAIEGLEDIEEVYVRRRITVEPGEVFSPEELERTRKALYDTGVFSSAVITWGTRRQVGPDGRAPITITLAESDARSIGAGAWYSSSEGFGARGFWEHRNMFGEAEKLRAELEVSQILLEGALSYRSPDFMRVDQTLLLDLKLDSSETPAYDRRALTLQGGVERAWSERLVLAAGLLAEQSLITSGIGRDDTYTLFGIPLGLRYDGSDNLLNPTRGHRTNVSITPYASVLGASVQMLVMRGTESVYVPFGRHVWATRLTLGSIIGPARGDVPHDRRFYAGGGDSVRGYDFQKVGPLLCEGGRATPGVQCNAGNRNTPIGGRSLLQVGTELRIRITDTIGLVPFVEGAGVYEPSYPDFGEDMRWGAGLGIRYFTVAGPIRLDVAVPLNPRKMDDTFEIYISLGQAF